MTNDKKTEKQNPSKQVKEMARDKKIEIFNGRVKPPQKPKAKK